MPRFSVRQDAVRNWFSLPRTVSLCLAFMVIVAFRGTVGFDSRSAAVQAASESVLVDEQEVDDQTTPEWVEPASEVHVPFMAVDALQDGGWTRQYIVTGVLDKYQRAEVSRAGAVIDSGDVGWVEISASLPVVAQLRALGYEVEEITPPARVMEFPPEDSDYHDYSEMLSEIEQAAEDHANILHLFSIGQSYEGRELWVAKVSDNPLLDESEPEVLISVHQHAREHLTVEQGLYILHLLTDEYHTTPLVKDLVDSREVFILFDANPDGGEYDHLPGYYQDWRKNRQPNEGSSYVGTDLNRNWSYQWGCCGGSSSDPSSILYRGPNPFSAPETDAARDFVDSRVVDGVQQITTYLDIHTYGELVLWPYGYTTEEVPSDMTVDDHIVFITMGQSMASLSGYRADQSGYWGICDGTSIDWMYGEHGIFSFALELYPRYSNQGGFYPPDEVIPAETERNRDALLYFLVLADCPYRAIGKEEEYCSTGSEPTPTSIAESDLRGFWSLDEVAGRRYDSSGWGNHLEEYNTVGSGVGQVGLAADLESGAHEYLSIGAGEQEGLDIRGSLTLVGWMNPESLERWQILAAKYEWGRNNRGYRLDLRPGNLVGLIVSPDGSFEGGYLLEANPGFTLSRGEWYHVAGVFDAEQRTLTIYLNGDLIGRRTVTYETVYETTAGFYLGANLDNGNVTQTFDGRLDEWRVYSRALSEGEIEELMGLSP